MDKITQENIQNAFAGESKAHMRYLIFSEKAEKEGRPNIARLFKAIAYAEKVHAGNHLKVLDGIKNTEGNLGVAIEGEDYEVKEMYPAYNNQARLSGEKEAEKSTHYALEAEKIHSRMYRQAKKANSQGKDIELGKVYICPVCGYTVAGEVPQFCPVCGVKSDTFKEF